MNVLAVLKTAGKTAVRWTCTHKKALLITAGVACTAGAIVVATAQAPLAKEALEALPEPTPEESKIDILVKKAKTVAPIMWPVPVLGIAGTACFCTAVHISAKEVTRAVSDGLAWKQAYNELAHIHNDYVIANRKISGEENHEKVMGEVQENIVKRTITNGFVNNTGKGEDVFYIPMFGVFFRSTAEHIANAALKFSYDMGHFQLPNARGIEGFGSVAELLELYIGVHAATLFEDIGYYADTPYCTRSNPFNLHITDLFVTAPDGSPARIIEVENAPCSPEECWY